MLPSLRSVVISTCASLAIIGGTLAVTGVVRSGHSSGGAAIVPVRAGASSYLRAELERVATQTDAQRALAAIQIESNSEALATGHDDGALSAAALDHAEDAIDARAGLERIGQEMASLQFDVGIAPLAGAPAAKAVPAPANGAAALQPAPATERPFEQATPPIATPPIATPTIVTPAIAVAAPVEPPPEQIAPPRIPDAATIVEPEIDTRPAVVAALPPAMAEQRPADDPVEADAAVDADAAVSLVPLPRARPDIQATVATPRRAAARTRKAKARPRPVIRRIAAPPAVLQQPAPAPVPRFGLPALFDRSG